MQVYVLSEGFDYEGSSVLGVYASEEEVRAAYASMEDRDDSFAHYFYEVVEVGAEPGLGDVGERVYFDRGVA